MAVFEQQFGSMSNGNLLLFMVIDDKNSADTTRWRTTQIRVENNTEANYYVYMEDRTVTPPVTFGDTFLAGTSRTVNVPGTYQQKSPDELGWGAYAV